jgi:hypothetical protein
MLDLVDDIMRLVICFLAIKAVTIGSGFNFLRWLKSPSEYWKRYSDWLEKCP